jgi:acyl-coenzyme A synthetase/AMP-(fatty) acid ligase
LIGGEALSVGHVKKAYEQLKGIRIINGYGPTEGTTFTCCYGIPRELGEKRSIPIGVPIGNTRVYVLDERMEPVPEGVGGEVFIGGDGLARGYLRRGDLTAEKFVPDAFGSEPGGRLYRTGDLARYLANGEIEYLGRMDEQVKVRGYRIELGEVEAVLAQHPRVEGCAVVVREDEPGDKRLVGYVVWSEGEAGRVEDLREHLRGKLPEYMVPSVFVVLDELPLSANGKLERRRLPAPEVKGGRGSGYEEPVGEVERAVAGVWGEVLKVKRVGLDDNFFDLGGHSLLLVRVHERLRQLFPRDDLSVVSCSSTRPCAPSRRGSGPRPDRLALTGGQPKGRPRRRPS